MKSQILTKSDKNGSRYPRSSSPREDYRNPVKRILVWIVSTLLLTGILAFTVLLVWAFASRNMPALEIWHTASLSTEFTARDATPKSTLQDYLDQEERLFSELKEIVYDRVAPTDDLKFNRYRAGGPQDPGSWETNWNRTFELVPENIQGGAFAGAMSVSPGIWLYQLTDDGLALELTAKGTKYYKDDDLN